jgi:hypothetical protein
MTGTEAAPENPSDVETLDLDDVVARIRAQAEHDPAALELLALYERGVVKRRAVLRTGMTAGNFRGASKRLRRYASVAKREAAAAAPNSPAS